MLVTLESIGPVKNILWIIYTPATKLHHSVNPQVS